MAVCDVDENAVKGTAEKLGIKAFTDWGFLQKTPM
jgi:hypothetical protein